MAHHSVGKSLLGLARSFKRLNTADPLTQCLVPRLRRGFASETSIPVEQSGIQSTSQDLNFEYNISQPASLEVNPKAQPHANPVFNATSRILTTLYSWPNLEPESFAWYNSKYLDMPLRRDILHRAVIYEGDATRQGTASTKWRADVHGSNRKILQQKGTGRARAGDKKSPTRRGGGVAFGPKPRDFSTELQRKVYDIAWRTALSYRYRKGELIILSGSTSIPESATARFLANIFETNQWGQGNGRSLLVTNVRRPALFKAMKQVGEHGLVKDLEDVDVKDLLETGRIIMERRALNNLLGAHSSDLGEEWRLDAKRKWALSPESGILEYKGIQSEL